MAKQPLWVRATPPPVERPVHTYLAYYKDAEGHEDQGIIEATTWEDAWTRAKELYGAGVHQVVMYCPAYGPAREMENYPLG